MASYFFDHRHRPILLSESRSTHKISCGVIEILVPEAAYLLAPADVVCRGWLRSAYRLPSFSRAWIVLHDRDGEYFRTPVPVTLLVGFPRGMALDYPFTNQQEEIDAALALYGQRGMAELLTEIQETARQEKRFDSEGGYS